MDNFGFEEYEKWEKGNSKINTLNAKEKSPAKLSKSFNNDEVVGKKGEKDKLNSSVSY